MWTNITVHKTHENVWTWTYTSSLNTSTALSFDWTKRIHGGFNPSEINWRIAYKETKKSVVWKCKVKDVKHKNEEHQNRWAKHRTRAWQLACNFPCSWPTKSNFWSIEVAPALRTPITMRTGSINTVRARSSTPSGIVALKKAWVKPGVCPQRNAHAQRTWEN